MTNRRNFLKSMAGILPASILIQTQGGYGAETLALEKKLTNRDYFKELGIRPFINAAAPYSSLSGAEMWPEVIKAMGYASKRPARLNVLHDEVGKRIAKMVDCEAAMVPAGATSAITLGTAACMTGTDEALIKQIPNTKGMRNEIITQKSHRYEYDHAVRNCGARFVEVETAEDIKRAINKNTAMMLFVYAYQQRGQIKAREYAALGKEYDIFTFIDGSTTVPPVENLSRLIEFGYDLAAFSGGKGLRGPFSAGLLLGRKDLIEAARLNTSPYDDTIGRGMKVSKEELLGMMVAVEVSMKHDYKAGRKEKEKWIKLIADQVASIPGLKAEITLPEVAERSPGLTLRWDESVVKITPAEAKRQLKEDEPSIEVASFFLTKGVFKLNTWMMKPGEAETVARRLREVLEGAL